MTDITELAQRNELLIANGQQTADLLRHLADNEIDSDYFAVVSECESYGKETDAELSITEFALRAAGYVDALVEALEKAQTKADVYDMLRDDYGLREKGVGLADFVDWQAKRITELESRAVTVKLPKPKNSDQGWKIDPEFINKVQDAIGYDDTCECWEGTPSMELVEAVLLAAAGIKVEAE
ncbi:TPA: ead/Ea22-like family protein [Klebsiella quasipneumoniae subsp. similipneumoniae]